jgi:hypothetical protein
MFEPLRASTLQSMLEEMENEDEGDDDSVVSEESSNDNAAAPAHSLNLNLGNASSECD